MSRLGNENLLVADDNRARSFNLNRSPWSNEFSPPLSDATYPSSKLRKLEITANEAFDTYRELYFEGGVSSVYFWDMDVGFAGVILIKKGRWSLSFFFERVVMDPPRKPGYQ